MLRIIGDSHTLALAARHQDTTELEIRSIGPGGNLRKVASDSQINPDFIDIFAPGKRELLLVLGNETYNSICVQRGQVGTVTDIRFAGHAEHVPGAAIVTEELIRRALRHRLSPIRDIGAVCPVGWLCPGPPPTRDERLIRENYAKRDVVDLVISSAETRLQCWKLQCEVLEELAGEIGASFMPAPKSAQDDDGYLRPELQHDGTHGNRHYDDLFLEYVLDVRARRLG